MTTATGQREEIARLTGLIQDVRVAMMTTATADGSLRSRPMLTRSVGADAALWFFARADAAKVTEALEHPRVNLSYADPRRGHYVSVSGLATLVRDRERMRQLWDESERAWFPRGLDEPDLALLRVSVERAEYWDPAAGEMVHVEGSWLAGEPEPGAR